MYYYLRFKNLAKRLNILDNYETDLLNIIYPVNDGKFGKIYMYNCIHPPLLIQEVTTIKIVRMSLTITKKVSMTSGKRASLKRKSKRLSNSEEGKEVKSFSHSSSILEGLNRSEVIIAFFPKSRHFACPPPVQ